MSINSRGTFAKIHLDNLRHNINFVKSRIGAKTFICPMIKADGYGHGDVIIGRELERVGVSGVGVISIEEAIHLRQSQLKLPILVFDAFDSQFAREVIEYNLTPVVSTYAQIEALKPFVQKPLKIHLKFNTGMNRLGFSPNEAEELFDKLGKEFEVQGICTHFINGEDADLKDGFSAQQLHSFAKAEAVFKKVNPIVHYLNSAAMLVTQKQNIGCRPGISIYGISPLSKPRQHDLKPVMSIHSRIELIQKVKRGEVVSYGPHWKAKRDSIVGVIPIGYADGYFRGLTNKGEMIYKGKKVSVCGVVCMDYCMVDLTDVNEALRVGDPITVVGEEQGVAITMCDLAEKLNTIPYEILTRIGKRLTRTALNPMAGS